MKHKIAAIIPALLFITAVPKTESQAPARPLVEGNTAFALSMYGELAAEKGNVFFSPYSISMAMAMVYSGARGNTAVEMEKPLNFQAGQQLLPAAFKTLTGELMAGAAKDNQKLHIANGLCMTGGGGLTAEYINLIQQQYDGEIFSGGVGPINDWVKKKTEGKIDKILTSLNPNSVCVLLNAIYFKGTWERQFDKKTTRDCPFNVPETGKTMVPFMWQTSDFRMIDKGDFRAVSIPYSGNRLSMVILLPAYAVSIDKLEKQFTAGNLNQWLAELDRIPPRKVILALPKFKMETDYELIPPFKALGIKDAFGNADFSGMDGKKDLYISGIKHKAFVEVNEEGTEAAAVTAVEMSVRGAGGDHSPEFVADHPFLLMIRDNVTGTILFMGRIVDPSSA